MRPAAAPGSPDARSTVGLPRCGRDSVRRRTRSKALPIDPDREETHRHLAIVRAAVVHGRKSDGSVSPLGAHGQVHDRTQGNRQILARLGDRQSVVHGPDGRLRPIADPDFAKDRLHVNLNGSFRDVDLARDKLVGIPFDQAVQDTSLSVGQPRCIAVSARRAVPDGRLSALPVGVRSTITIAIREIGEHRQHGRWQNRLSKHHQLERFDERVARTDFDEVCVGACAKHRHNVARLMVVGQDGDAAGRVMLLEDLDLSDSRMEVVTGVDNQKYRSLSRLCRQDKLVNRRCRRHDTKVGCVEYPNQALAKQSARAGKSD